MIEIHISQLQTYQHFMQKKYDTGGANKFKLNRATITAGVDV